MNPDLAQLLAELQAELAKPDTQWTAAGIDKVVAEETEKLGTRYPNLFALRMAVESGEDKRQAEGLTRVADRGALANTAGMAAHAGTFGMLDNLMRALGQDEAAEGWNEAVSENREFAPGASLAAEAMGGSLLPLGAGASVVRNASRMVRVPAAMGAGLGAGIVGGGLFGAGDSDTEEPKTVREMLEASVPGAVTGGAIGLLTGGVAGMAGERLSRVAGRRNARVARDLVENTGLEAAPRQVQEFAERTSADIAQVRANMYAPLEKRFKEVRGPEVARVVTEVMDNPDTRPFMSKMREVQRGKYPSFTELQDLERKLQKAGRPEAEALRDAMRTDIPGFEAADEAYAAAVAPRNAFEVGLGQKLDGSAGAPRLRGRVYKSDTANQLAGSLRRIPDEFREPFLTGVVHRDVTTLLSQDDPGMLKVWLQVPGAKQSGWQAEFAPEAERILEQYFPSPDKYQAFRDILAKERSGAKIREAFHKLAIAGALASGGAVGATLVGGRTIGN
jgi:hypothetical protein